MAIRFYIPPSADADPADKEAPTAAEQLQQRIMQTASIRKTTGDVLVSFPQEHGTFLTPRGRYGIELYDYFLRMRGQKYDYKIKVGKEESGEDLVVWIGTGTLSLTLIFVFFFPFLV